MEKKIYIISTLFIAILVGIAGGLVDILQTQAVIDTAAKLGFPLYFFFLLGIFKVAGGVTILLPPKFDRLKDLAYFGFTLDFIFASYSHYKIESHIGEVVIPLVLLIILALSFSLKNKTYFFEQDSKV